ncbi:MAG: DUF930 domain-containing protein [Devosia sp.]
MSMYFAEPRAIRREPWGALASVFVHLGLLTLLVLFSQVRPLDKAVVEPQSIAVQLFTLPRSTPEAAPVSVMPEPLTAPLAPTEAIPNSLTPRAPPVAIPTAAQPAKGLTKATQLFAAAMLKDPSNRKIVKTLSTFADSEKIVQLCNMEGLEQIRRADPHSNPDVLVSYAMADFTVDGFTLSADGGAFHSGKAWYAIRLRCTITPDYAGVADCQYALGPPIPKREWASHNLPVEYDDQE